MPKSSALELARADLAAYSAAIPMIPHTIVLEPGLVVFKFYNGYGV